MPLLEKVAARDARGNPCVGHAGLGGAGHYVKIVGAHVCARDRVRSRFQIHNGIEHGMMGAIAEAWKTMNTGLGLSYDKIGHAFAAWNESGELVSTTIATLRKQRH